MRRFPLIAFFGIACLITWSIWIPRALAAYGIISLQIPNYMGDVAYFIGPPLATIIVTWQAGGWAATQQLLSRFLLWRVGVRWYLIALSTRAVILVLVLLAGSVVGSTTLSSLGVLRLIALPTLIFDLIGRTFAHSGEELAWRGYALPYVQSTLRPFGASILVGLLWGIWHIPLFFSPGKAQYGTDIALFLVWIIAMSLLHTLLYNKTNGSLLMSSIFHAAYNTTTTFFPGVPIGLDVIVTWLVVGTLVWFYTSSTIIGNTTR